VILLTKRSIEGSFFHEGEWPAALRTKTPVLLIDLSDNASTSLKNAPGITIVSCSDEKAVPELVLKYIQSRKKYRLFISYSRKDNESAVRLTHRLEASLNKVWIDRSDVNQGEKSPEKIAKAIESCDYFVLLWSADSRRSRWVEREWNHAFKLGKSVLPILLDDTPLPMVLEDTRGFVGLDDPSIITFFDISQ
jgi:hypothetical protein